MQYLESRSHAIILDPSHVNSTMGNNIKVDRQEQCRAEWSDKILQSLSMNMRVSMSARTLMLNIEFDGSREERMSNNRYHVSMILPEGKRGVGLQCIPFLPLTCLDLYKTSPG